MEDLEIMKHAKSYIDQLAKGVDPLTGEVMEGDTTLNQVRISRCFFFISEVLAKVIDNGGIISSPTITPVPFSEVPPVSSAVPSQEPQQKPSPVTPQVVQSQVQPLVRTVTQFMPPVTEKKLKFTITNEEIARVPITDIPVGITEFCARITETVQNPNMSQLSTSKVTDWLEEKGYLQSEKGFDGKTKKTPTSLAIGISVEERSSYRYGIYQTNVYDKTGQEFILKNLQEMLKSNSKNILKERNTVHCNRVYCHFKGNLYYVHDLVVHTETEEEMVSYQALYPPYGMFVRPKKMFIEAVDPCRQDNLLKQGRRFELFNPSAIEGE